MLGKRKIISFKIYFTYVAQYDWNMSEIIPKHQISFSPQIFNVLSVNTLGFEMIKEIFSFITYEQISLRLADTIFTQTHSWKYSDLIQQ